MPSVGSPCAAKYSEDEAWYRAIIECVEAPGGGVLVRFVDYGNGEICQPYAVKWLHDRFMDAPIMCVKCALHGLHVWMTAV